MSNTETRPQEVVCGEDSVVGEVEVLTPRDVPLGGPRAMRVRRTLPQRQRSLIGAWCFVDHYGPDDVSDGPGMQVPPHPHTGLSTVSWLFSGEIRHRDSACNDAMVLPGELNLMTAGSGISHSERSTPDSPPLHGAQLWLALPESTRFTDRRFDHYVPPEVDGPGWQAQVFLGSALGSTSPVAVDTPLLGLELRLEAGTSLSLDMDPEFEHGVLVDTGEATVAGEVLAQDHLGYLAPGRSAVTVESGAGPLRVLVLGGTPFGEQIVMWWNFVGRSHDEIVEFRRQWQAEAVADGSTDHQQYGLPDADPGDPLPAPELPNAQIKPRQ